MIFFDSVFRFRDSVSGVRIPDFTLTHIHDAKLSVRNRQMLVSHVLGLQTPLLRQGEVTDSFPFIHILVLQWKLS